MKPDYVIHHGDCRSVLATLPEKSCHMCVCSPPYWSLRKYEGVEPSVWGGDAECQHEWEDEQYSKQTGGGWAVGNSPDGKKKEYALGAVSQGTVCRRCSAWRGLLGLEPRIEMYVEHIVECFREVKRVLRDDGTLWLNIGVHGNIAPKQNAGQAWRVAFALQADGWYLRQDIIWHKPNPMPESVRDRPTKAHEYLFLLTKQPRYYYDAEAVRERHAPASIERCQPHRSPAGASERAGLVDRPTGGSNTLRLDQVLASGGRNKRSVWTIPTEGNPEAHFASFPRKLVLPCILAGTSEKGCCPECGTGWVRLLEKDRRATRPARDNKRDETGMANRDHERHVTDVKTVGWKPGCECGLSYQPERLATREMALDAGDPSLEGSIVSPEEFDGQPHHPEPCTVLDLFVGSGTAGIVATQQGRRFIGIDASAEYCEMARRRIANPEPEPEPIDAEGQMTFEEIASDG